MNILWLSHFVPFPPKSGCLNRSYNLLRQLSRYHNIYLLAFTQQAPLRAMYQDIASGLADAHRHLAELCAHVEFVDIACESRVMGRYRLALRSLFLARPYTVNWLVSDAMERAVATVIAQNTIHAVHFDTISLSHYLDNVGELPKTLTHHNVESHMMLRRAKTERNPLKSAYFGLEGARLTSYERQICKRFDFNIVCSGLDAQRLADVAPDCRSIVIENGVDTADFAPLAVPEQPNSLVYVGGMDWYPNRDAMAYFFSRLWPRLKASCAGVSIDVVGTSPPPFLKEIARQDTAVRVHGFVEDVRPLIARAALYICPVAGGCGGTKLKLLEALSMAKCAVAHPLAIEGLALTDGENIVLAESDDSFSRAVVEHLGNRHESRKIGRRGRELVRQRYDYSNLGRRLADLYTDLLGE